MFNHSYTYRDFEADAELLYAHFMEHRKSSSLDEILKRFQSLFLDGTSYTEPHILGALHRLVSSAWADSEFCFVLNRCCYILVNYWLVNVSSG